LREERSLAQRRRHAVVNATGPDVDTVLIVPRAVLPDGYADLLERPLFAHVALIAADGTPRSYPMWFLWEDGSLFLTNTTSRPQTRILRRVPHLALSIIDPHQPYRYLGLAATVEGISPDPRGTFFDRLAAHYSLDVRLDDPSDRVVIAARPTAFWSQ
jgi:PPOX class probable F420-dependent enzyme